MSEGKAKKLAMLADQYGLSVGELLEEWALDSVVPGICMNPNCEYTAEYEPDQSEGWCGACGTQTVQSAFVLLGVI